jgi:putative peptidoglycan lipid II flippase
VVAICILLGGVVQIAVQWPALRRAGIVFRYQGSAIAGSLKNIWSGFFGTALGLAITQLNTLMDCLFAWGLAATATSGSTMPWFGWHYPLQTGATAALYFGERMYQLPLGLIGVATATVVFPRFARHAASNDRRRLGNELTGSLKFALLLALSAGVGLMLLAQPIARLLFEHGQFTHHDSQRTAGVIAAYATGVWAYCLLPVIVRGFYAVGDRRTPILVGAASMLINLTLDLTLVWPLGEIGLATATAVSAMFQTIVLTILFSRRHASLDWAELRRTLACAVAAVTAMALAVWATNDWLSRQFPSEHDSLLARAIQVAGPMTVGVLVYASILGGFAWLRSRTKRDPVHSPDPY